MCSSKKEVSRGYAIIHTLMSHAPLPARVHQLFQRWYPKSGSRECFKVSTQPRNYPASKRESQVTWSRSIGITLSWCLTPLPRYLSEKISHPKAWTRPLFQYWRLLKIADFIRQSLHVFPISNRFWFVRLK